MDATVLFSTVELFEDTFTFLSAVVALFGLLGVLSRHMMVGSWTAFSAFSILAFQTGFNFFQTLMYVMIVLISIVVGGQMWSVAFGGE